MFFFHIRRFDGTLERDDIGLDVTSDDLLREADAGARGLLIESIAQGDPSTYRRFEIADTSGNIVVTFDFARVLRAVECAIRPGQRHTRAARRGCTGSTRAADGRGRHNAAPRHRA